jgi:tRNA 2-thiouridine synthesizing protein A
LSRDDGPVIIETVDARGLVCPMPTLRLAQAMKRVPVGAVVELLSDDPGSELNMAAWVRNTGQELLLSQEEAETWRFQIRRVK